MARQSRLVCECGGEISRPIPPNCPHCGRIIASVRRPAIAWLWPLIAIGLLFALLVGGVLVLVRMFGPL